MSWRANLILFILAVALSGYVFFFENAPADWVPLGKFFRNVEPRDIYEIEISQPALARDSSLGVDARPVLLRREPYEEKTPRWWIVEPLRSPALHPRVQGICYLIADLVRVAEVGPDTNPFPPEGPVLSVRFKTRLGEEWTIQVGKDHADSDWDVSYVRVGDETFVTRKEFRKNAQVTLDNLRSRALFPVSVPDAQDVVIRATTADDKRFVRDGTSQRWRLEAQMSGFPLRAQEPQNVLADRRHVEELVEKLNGWRIREFVRDDASDADALAAYGLAGPRLVVTATHKDGRSFTVEIGDDVPAEHLKTDGAQEEALPQVYARHAGKPFVYRVDSALLEWLSEETEVFRSRYLFEMGTDAVSRMRVEIMRGEKLGEGIELRELVVGDEEPVWQVQDLKTNEVAAGDRVLISGLLDELRHLKIDRFLSEAEIAELETGLSPPWAQVRLWTSSGRELEYSIGAPSPDPVDVGLDVYFTARRGEPGAYLTLSRLRRSLELGSRAFRNRAISTLDPAKVYELELYLRDPDSPSGSDGRLHTWSIGRVPGAEWVVSQDTPLQPGKRLHSDLVDQLVDELHRETFRVLRYLPEVRDFPERRLELSRPYLGMKLTKVDGEESGGFKKLVIGLPLEEATEIEYLARVDVQDVPPFALSAQIPTLLEKLTRHLQQVTSR